MLCMFSPSLVVCTNTNTSRNLPTESLKPLVEALLSKLPDDPSSIVITVKSDAGPQSSQNEPKSFTGLAYDPSLVYILELCTVLALRDSETINALGGQVAEALQNVMRNAPNYHHIMVARSMYYVLHLLHASYVCNIFHFQTPLTCHRSKLSSEFLLFSTPYLVLRRICLRNLHLSYSKV